MIFICGETMVHVETMASFPFQPNLTAKSYDHHLSQSEAYILSSLSDHEISLKIFSSFRGKAVRIALLKVNTFLCKIGPYSVVVTIQCCYVCNPGSIPGVDGDDGLFL